MGVGYLGVGYLGVGDVLLGVLVGKFGCDLIGVVVLLFDVDVVVCV